MMGSTPCWLGLTSQQCLDAVVAPGEWNTSAQWHLPGAKISLQSLSFEIKLGPWGGKILSKGENWLRERQEEWNREVWRDSCPCLIAGRGSAPLLIPSTLTLIVCLEFEVTDSALSLLEAPPRGKACHWSGGKAVMKMAESFASKQVAVYGTVLSPG